VARARAGLEGPLLRVVAGAGYGKTTLLAMAAEAIGRPLAWIGGARPGASGLSRALAEALGAPAPRSRSAAQRIAALWEAVAAR
jgi:ATP/maltotriose-dependent transcriptional regulator MalT